MKKVKIFKEQTEHGLLYKFNFTDGTFGGNPYLYEREINVLENCFGCATDLNYTIRRIENKLIVWYNEKQTFCETFNVTKFFKAVRKLPLKKEFTLNLSSFEIERSKEPVNKTAMEIINDPHFDKSALVPFLNGAKKGFLSELKNKLGGLIDAATICADSYSNSEMNFYFNGRIPNGCGYNGGIIYHSYCNSYSIHT